MRLKLILLVISTLLLSNIYSADYTIKIGVRNNYPPYEFKSNNRLIGFNIDILNQLSDVFSFEIEFVEGDSDRLFQLLDSGQIDLVSFCFQSQDFKENYNLSIPYNMVAFGIYIPYQSAISQPQDIMPYKVSLQNELLYEMMLNNKSFAGDLVLRRTQDQCLKDIIKGDAEAAIISSLTGKYLIEKHNYTMIKVPPINFKNLQYSFAFHRENDSLLVQINEGLNILRETGTYDRMYQKWFGEVHPKQIAEQQNVIIWPYYVLAIIILLLLFLFVNQRKNYLHLKSLNQKEVDMRLNAEKMLYELEHMTQNIIDKLPHIFMIRDADRRYSFANQTITDLLGIKKEELINTNTEVSKMHGSNMLDIIDPSETNEEFKNHKVRLIDSDSQLRIFEITRTKIRRAVTREEVFVIIGIDESKREKYERLLNREKALMNSLINSIPDLIFYKNKNLEYLGANEAFKNFTKIKSDEDLIGKKDIDLFQKNVADSFQVSDERILSTGKPEDLSGWEVGPKGERVLYFTVKVPIVDDIGDIIGLVGISRDITKQAEIQDQLQKAKVKAEESDKLKTTFLNNLSHEIRTPLNSIIGFSDLLTDPDITDDQREDFTELISKSGASLLTLVDDIIDLSKIEANQVQISLIDFEVNKMIANLHEAIEDTRDQIHKKSVELKFNIPHDHSEVFLKSDEFRVRQVLSNLIKNALKYTSKGDIEFGYRIEDEDIVFYVKDSGLGIPEEQKANIFERYNHSTSIESFGGSGLGLSISKKLVDLLGGKIDFVTDELKGSEFYFTLPYEKSKSKNARSNIELYEQYNWSDYHILVAEDEQNNYLFIEEALKRTGANIIWAKDGAIALEHVKNNPKIDIVLMDIKMPNMDGYQATREIKKIRKNLPVIAQTAYAMSNERNLSIQAGCDEYLTKPIRPKKLLKKIDDLI
jgi:PAS domain S-box-containing protein